VRSTVRRAWFPVGGALLLTLLAAMPSTYAASTGFTSTASVSPNSVSPGSPVTITAAFTSNSSITNVTLDVEVRDSVNSKVFQQAFTGQSFSAGQTSSVTTTWSAPSTASGLYTVKTGAFSADWSIGYGWNDNAATITVSTSSSSTGLQVTSSATVSPAQVNPGGSTQIASVFTASASASNITLDVEVRNSANTKIFQQAFTGQSLSAGQTRSFTSTWAVPSTLATGSYTVKTGSFSADWATGYGWNDNAASITVGSGPIPTPTATLTSTPSPTPTPTSLPSTGTYYVDCSGGNDANSGTDTTHAWASLSRANQAALQPGNALLLKRGCTWTGPLNVRWIGTALLPITIGAYGSGNLPQIQNTSTQVPVSGSYVILDSLHVRSDPDSYTGCNNNPIGARYGIAFQPGSAHNVVQNSLISDLAVGVFFESGSQSNQLKNSQLANNIMLFNVDPYVNDGGAQAVLISGDSNDVGYNQIYGSYACSTRYGVDGTAVEVWGGGSNNRIHHNVTWNNSEFTELANSTNTVYAYNIVNGHAALTNHAGVLGTTAYNNVFYSTGGSGDNGIVCNSCSPSALTLMNNIIWAAGGVSASGQHFNEGYNIYWSNNGSPYLDTSISSTSKVINPQFVNPGVDFHLQSTSPAINAGTLASVTAGWTLDLSGTTVPLGGLVDSGAYETR